MGAWGKDMKCIIGHICFKRFFLQNWKRGVGPGGGGEGTLGGISPGLSMAGLCV